MAKQKIQETAKIAPTPEIPLEEQVSQREIPLPKVIIDATGAGKNAYKVVVTRWNELPRERQRLFALVGISVITSVTMSLIATVIARSFVKRRKLAQ